MKVPRMAHAIGHIDDDLVAQAAQSKKTTRRSAWVKWGSLAACVAALAIVAVSALPHAPQSDSDAENRYESSFSSSNEIAIMWPWEYETTLERYTSIEIDGVTYISRGRKVSESLVGEYLGTYTATGRDELNNEVRTAEFEAYALNDVSRSWFVAVKMDGSYCVFMRDDFRPDGYDHPSTLGELMSQVNLPKVAKLGQFTEGGDGPNNAHFELADDRPVWNVLATCEDARFVEDETAWWENTEIIRFTFSSEALGIYNRAFTIARNGYVETNAFDYSYVFFIGEEAAGEIFAYAKGNSTEVEYKPHRNPFVIGTVAQIENGWLYVDDSAFCKNPKEGRTCKIPLDDLRISRYIDCGYVKIGSTVKITYEGEIDDDGTIEGATSLTEVTVSNGNAKVLE